MQLPSYRASKLAKMATGAYLGPLATILVNILQDLSIGSISKNVPLNEGFQLSQSWGGGSCHGQTTGQHHRVTKKPKIHLFKHGAESMFTERQWLILNPCTRSYDLSSLQIVSCPEIVVININIGHTVK